MPPEEQQPRRYRGGGLGPPGRLNSVFDRVQRPLEAPGETHVVAEAFGAQRPPATAPHQGSRMLQPGNSTLTFFDAAKAMKRSLFWPYSPNAS